MFWTNYCYLCTLLHKTPNGVASEIGVKSSASVTAWKKNSIPRDGVLIRIANYFGVTVDELLHDDLTKKYLLPSENSAKKLPTPITERELDEKFTITLDDLTSDEIAKVHAFVSGLKASRKP